MILTKRIKYLAVNLILFAVLYLSVTFNKEYIRPVYSYSPIIGIITGSFSNFMAAYIISLFPVAPLLAKNIEIRKARIIIYLISILVFLILSIEEIYPMWGVSTQYDLNDILASGIGSILAVLTFELIIKRRLIKRKTPATRRGM
jgi:hypothetical protein